MTYWDLMQGDFTFEVIWNLLITIAGVFIGLYLQQLTTAEGKRRRLNRLMVYLKIEINENNASLEEIAKLCDKITERVEKSTLVSHVYLHTILNRVQKMKTAAFETLKNFEYSSELPIRKYVPIANTYERIRDISFLVTSIERMHTVGDEEARRQGVSDKAILADAKQGLLEATAMAKQIAIEAKESGEEVLKII